MPIMQVSKSAPFTLSGVEERAIEIKFNKTVTYETGGPGKGPVFEKDHTYRLPEDMAQRWIRRGVADPVEAEKPLNERTHVSGPEKKDEPAETENKPEPEKTDKPEKPSEATPKHEPAKPTGYRR